MQEIESLTFHKFCVTIAPFPENFLDSMTNLELLYWLCNYLENTVIPAVNNNGECVTELQNLFTELKNYCDNYFDNLDVQEEINNKLDEMAANGTLTTLLEPYLENLQDSIVSQNTRLTTLENRVDEIVETPSASTENNQELIDIRVGADGTTYTTAGSAVRTQITNTENIAQYAIKNLKTIYNLEINNDELTQVYHNNDYTTKPGENKLNVNTPQYLIYPKSVIKININYFTTFQTLKIWFFDKNKQLLYRRNITNLSDDYSIEIILPNDCYYVAFSLITNTEVNVNVFTDNITISIDTSNFLIDNQATYVNGRNLANPKKCTTGFLNQNGSIESTFTNYKTSDFIKVKKGDKIYVSEIRAYCFYYPDKVYINDSFVNLSALTEDYTILVTFDGFIRISCGVNTNVMIAILKDDETSIDYEDYYLKLDKQDELTDFNNLISSNVLYNKKYTACGDSYTFGDFSSLTDDTDTYIENGLYTRSI